jgi:alkylation response protein AidB-like acyl-CoA dehydrogenase
VSGLEGTGSKDIVVTDTFVPDYRTIDVVKVLNGQAFEESSRTQALYRMPWSSLFPSAVTAGVIGIAEGLLKSAVDYQRDRVSAVGVAQATDPHTRATIGEAAAEIRGSRAQLLYNVGELYEAVCAGHDITLEQRVACRRDQVRVAWRAAEAADKVFANCGGNSIRLDNPVQRFWRGMHAGLHHGIVVRGQIYDAAAGMLWGEPPTGPAAMTI